MQTKILLPHLLVQSRSIICPIISFLFLLAVFLIAVYTFLLQKSYSTSTLEANVDQNITCSDAIHKLVSNTFTRDDFTDINTVDDMSSEQYQTLQTTLNQIRSLNSTRYLYTAKRNSEGKLIYLVDGLDLDTSDFAYPGTYIEDEMIPYINSALSGKTIYSQETIDTTWGHIFTACYPVKATDGSNEIIGALCIEMDMESAYTFLSKSSRNSLQIAIAAAIVALLLLVCVYHILQNQRAKDREQQMLLRKSAAAAEAANKAKSAFLFNMSHDIRTPMNAIIGYAELSRNHLHEPDKLSEYLSNIRTCGQKMLSIINNILEIARIENNQIVLEESICNIEESFDSCIVMFNTAVQEKHQTITVHKQVAILMSILTVPICPRLYSMLSAMPSNTPGRMEKSTAVLLRSRMKMPTGVTWKSLLLTMVSVCPRNSRHIFLNPFHVNVLLP